ncbi:MAG: adenine-specific methyltransferase EcoRI family protein [Acidaminococcaceae bacterium]|nr:adenine-specific methyltransferase EcoRI family protein [Acidaminococcaceae bacterium]
MGENVNLHISKRQKNDEFYTQYADIEAEMNAYVEFNPDVFRDKTILLPCDDPEWSNFTKYFASNFERFGIKKLISTSYAKGAGNKQLTLFEENSPLYDAEKHETRGKLFTLTHDTDGSGNIDTDDIEFLGYLEGDGDFRSEEVSRLRDDADIIVTNPPFSLFREFLSWIMDVKKQFIIIGNQNAITYKEVFPLLQENLIWLGNNEGGSRKGNSMFFIVPDDYDNRFVEQVDGKRLMQTTGKWFTNIDHGKRHEILQLDTMAHNLKFNKKLKKKLETEYGKLEYPHYDNYDAIEVPFTECIPSDYDRVMGVPITFMDKYNPEQFEILGFWNTGTAGDVIGATKCEASSSGKTIIWNGPTVSGKTKYFRILIRKRKSVS